MEKSDARVFAGAMEDLLDIPSFLCEAIEAYLVNDRYQDVCEFVVNRLKTLQDEKVHTNFDHYFGSPEMASATLDSFKGYSTGNDAYRKFISWMHNDKGRMFNNTVVNHTDWLKEEYVESSETN